MAEAAVQNQNGANGTGAQPNQNGQAHGGQPDGQQQSQEPKWLSYIPEAEREEAKKGWMLQSDYSKKTGELAEQRKTYETAAERAKRVDEWEKWHKESYSPFIKQLEANWAKIEPILSGKVVEPKTQTADPNQNLAQHFANWDVLPPEEQGKRLADFVNNQYVQTALQKQQEQYNQALQQQLGGLRQQFENYMNVLHDAYDKKFADPKFPIKDYLNKSLEIMYGKVDPRELAFQAITGPQQIETMKQEWLKKGREEAELEFKNKLQNPGALQQQNVPLFRQAPQKSSQITDSIRQLAIEKGYGW